MEEHGRVAHPEETFGLFEDFSFLSLCLRQRLLIPRLKIIPVEWLQNGGGIWRRCTVALFSGFRRLRACPAMLLDVQHGCIVLAGHLGPIDG